MPSDYYESPTAITPFHRGQIATSPEPGILGRHDIRATMIYTRLLKSQTARRKAALLVPDPAEL